MVTVQVTLPDVTILRQPQTAQATAETFSEAVTACFADLEERLTANGTLEASLPWTAKIEQL